MIKIVTFIALLGFLWSCSSNTDDTSSQDRIFGHWELLTSETEVELYIFEDSTFHVDVLMLNGIEVEGKLILDEKNITFINIQGTDSLSSDPAPGIYEYYIDKQNLEFEKIEDPLSRRANFLSQKWQRVE